MNQDAPQQGFGLQKIVMISIIAGLGTLVLGAAIAYVIQSSQYATFTDEYYKIQMKYPKKWTVRKDYGGTVVAIVAPLDNSLDNFNENINISVVDLPPEVTTLDKFTKIAMLQTETIFGRGIEIVESTAIVLDGRQAYRYIVRNKEEPVMQLGFIWYFKDNKAFIITHTMQMLQYQKYKGIFKYMLNSYSMAVK